MSRQVKGFTLIEMVTVIIILGVLSVGISSFLQFGARIFSETSERDELISAARFAVERLNREVRNAAPNSIEVDNSSGFDCLTFIPIAANTIYLDLPVSPESANNQVELIPFNKDNFSMASRVVVYPISPADYLPASDKNHEFSVLDDSAVAPAPWTLSFSSPKLFATDSPTKRFYFYGDNVSYCVEGKELVRYQNDISRTLMAENLANYLDENGNAYTNSDDVVAAFEVISASQTRNATALIRLVFALNNEQVAFNNEVQIPNVP
ncbi:type II secretion system protein [Thalassotalea sp. G2M2-11]|uniref:PulJ/GspJ family protein n=1 Tax=Thalassotalea sp. G2M2-11 TaxID=2787627 RepID=UPI0019D0D3D9|nr:type II secretion system protein [Thalassotalea sp. G2M2-11]